MSLWWYCVPDILFVMPHSKKGLGRCHKSGTGNNQGRQRTTPRDNWGFNRNDCYSKSIKMSLLVISVSLPLNNSVINPPHLSSVCQHSKSNELSSPVIPKPTPWNDTFIIVAPKIWLSSYDGNWQIKYQAHNITTNSYFICHATFQEGSWEVPQKWNREQSG